MEFSGHRTLSSSEKADTKSKDKGHDDHDDHHLSAYVIFVLFIQLGFGLLAKMCSAKIGIPYTLLISIIGLIMGVYHKEFGATGKGILSWSKLGAHDILLVFLPALVFESAFSVNWHIMKRQLG